ncbi:hypothetical protein C7974DRAFT_361139 [Boeremia exigua]|uniref:uncharacterized protein n=1 Tax=Boeremia exigua TaxID=749465 RepID=UPI001E8E29C3|nr:uncharacterized protein C7974DRAFT_361139 [Boeremia exigua]KAH6625711.1 hypothetical protein C7974DRAFT_361139 [Boeremia exigua]
MDPESVVFQPRDDFWQFQGEMLRVQQAQAELTDRVARLERKQDDDSRLKNVWGTSSPFPSVLGGTPQQVPLQQPTAEHFSNFDDDQSSNLIGNLQLDADDEPRRVGTTSRANSVRFDETANHGHWAHASRTSLELLPRSSSSLGGHALSERSYSHKSDGRQSSAGQSVHSVTSGRANSLTSYGPATPVEIPGLAPGLFILGSVPSIIRCWLDTNFRHDTLLYAAICSGSHTSYLDLHLINHLEFQDQITRSDDGTRKIKLTVYLPEAVPILTSTQSESPAPQLPSITVEFTVVDEYDEATPKAVQIVIGSDLLRAHNADVLFSTNQLIMYDDDRSKLQVPLVRPEDESAFKSLSTSHGIRHTVEPGSASKTAAMSTPIPVEPKVKFLDLTETGNVVAHSAAEAGTADGSDDGGSSGRRSLDQRLHPVSTTFSRSESKDAPLPSPVTAAPRPGPPPATLSSWRRDTNEKTNSGSLDWANVGRTTAAPSGQPRREIKVLRPSRSSSRTFSSSTTAAGTGQSRYFDDGKRKDDEAVTGAPAPSLSRAMSGEKEENQHSGTKRPANPVGGASAFAWLKGGSRCQTAKHWSSTRCLAGHRPAISSNHTAPARSAPPITLTRHIHRLLPHFPREQLAHHWRRHAFPQHRPFFARLVCLGAVEAPGRPQSFTTASTKKRKTVTAAQTSSSQSGLRKSSPSSNEGSPAASLRSSPHPSTSPPPRFLPPHMKEAVKEASQENSSTPGVRGESIATGASSPSEAYANLSLESADGSMTDSSERTRVPSSDNGQRPAHRASSPAKRLHSDMDDASSMDVDSPAAANPRRGSNQSSPRPTKPLPAATALQRSARATSVEMADASSDSDRPESASPADLPSLDDQVAAVMNMMSGELQEGQEGYVVSEAWLERVFARTSEGKNNPKEYSKEATEGPIGPVDNSRLVDIEALNAGLVDQSGADFVPLSKGLMLHQNLEVLPAKAWELVVRWYGLKDGSPVIRRYVQNTVPDKSSTNLLWELYPPILTIRKVRKAAATPTEEAKSAQRIVASRSDNFQKFLGVAKRAAGIDVSNKMRVWRLLNTAPSDEPQPKTQLQPSGMLTPDASPRGGSPAAGEETLRLPLIMDTASFTRLAVGTEREQVTGKDDKANEDSNPSLSLDAAGLTQDQVIVLEEADEKGDFITDTTTVSTKYKTAAQLREGLKSGNTSGRSTPTGGPLTRGRTRSGKVRGQTGLTNLGNTCYMNSALQCLRSVEELSLYFLNDQWEREVNKVNPIGYKGQIASVYANLVNSIYSVNGSSSFSPKQFKQTLGRANSLFSGYGQQDSQEFLSWLIDALHEDLNRIITKPYKENPDSDDNTFRDPEAMKQLGEVYRANYRARNDSVSTDLFNGFYKNTMVCPECDKVSITFDPYSQLTLQLPIEQSWSHTITYVPLYGKLQQLDVDIDKNATIKTLKEYVGKRFGGVKANRLMASEVYSHKFYRHFDDNATISECQITTRDDVYFYELEHAPSNWPAPKKKAKYKSFMSHSSDEDIPNSASPLHDKVLVPVFQRGPSASSYRGSSYAMALWPFHIVVTREEAKDYDAILRKVLAKVAQSTSRPILTELGGNSSDQSRPGSDVVLTTEEDALPNSDPRVKDGSIEGEDMVEVTMTDAEVPVAGTAGHAELPEVLKDGAFINPEFRHLFEIKYSRKGNEFVPTGWNSIDHQKALDPISKRIPVPSERADSEQSSRAGSESSSEEDANSPHSAADADTEAAIEEANVSSDDEMPSIELVEPSEPLKGGRQKKKSKKARKHERKLERKQMNNKNWKAKKTRVPEQPVFADDRNDENEGLIRLGEAIVLDWNPEAFDALFGGLNADDSRGMDVLKTIETFDDPEIREKKAKRIARKKSGITLDECLTETSKSETLSEDNPWYCSNCKEMRRATKTLDIWTVPDILIFHLKRFSGFRSFRDKIDDKVDFPVEGLDLTGKVGFPEGKGLVYDLFAVDNHFGGLGGGHYTATAQNFFDKQWYNYNADSSVSLSSGREAVTKAAYLLFYRRRSSSPLGPESLQNIVQKDIEGGSDEDSDTENRSRSPAGNGSRLGGSSRNGSSRVGAAGAGAVVLRGDGSALSAAATPQGSLAKSGADLGILDGHSPPDYYDDETLGDDEGFSGIDTEGGMSGPHAPAYIDEPQWSFDTLNTRRNDSDDASSNAPALGSDSGEYLAERMLEDFGDDDTTYPGTSTPLHTFEPVSGVDDDDVKEIYIPSV